MIQINSEAKVHMRLSWLLSMIIFSSPEAFARSVDACPILPPGSGLEWAYSEGPDFDVCRAFAPGSDDLAFGIYLGNHPASIRSVLTVLVRVKLRAGM